MKRDERFSTPNLLRTPIHYVFPFLLFPRSGSPPSRSWVPFFSPNPTPDSRTKPLFLSPPPSSLYHFHCLCLSNYPSSFLSRRPEFVGTTWLPKPCFPENRQTSFKTTRNTGLWGSSTRRVWDDEKFQTPTPFPSSPKQPNKQVNKPYVWSWWFWLPSNQNKPPRIQWKLKRQLTEVQRKQTRTNYRPEWPDTQATLVSIPKIPTSYITGSSRPGEEVDPFYVRSERWDGSLDETPFLVGRESRWETEWGKQYIIRILSKTKFKRGSREVGTYGSSGVKGSIRNSVGIDRKGNTLRSRQERTNE